MSALIHFWRRRLFVFWFALLGASGVFACLLPLFETLGYEYALIIALVASLGAGQLAACLPHQVRKRLAPFPKARFPVLVLYGRALLYGLLLLVLPLLASLLNGLRVPQCNLVYGLCFYLLMPLSAVALASAVGLFFGLATPGSKSASALWFMAFIASLILAFARFHSTPAVFSFGPFYGYFPGVLYDELVAPSRRLVTYRASTLAQIGAVLACCTWLIDTAAIRLCVSRIASRPRSFAATIVFGVCVLAFHITGPYLGHCATREDLERHLSYKAATERLDLFFPPSTDKRTLDALVRDAQFSLSRIEEFFGAKEKERIAVFFFANASDKGALMGASGTNVAKPWRREVYVTLEEAPHSVLRHELAHIVASRFGRGPFAIAGSFGGLWPNPGLIEGLAVAADGPKGDLTLHQWARAMKELHILPELKRIFGLNFFDLSASTAYTTAGSFFRFLRDTKGVRAVQDLYRGASWKEATGQNLKELSEKWLSFLNAVPLLKSDLDAARYRFDRPSVIRTVCVHEVARLGNEAQIEMQRGNWKTAIDLLKNACERSGRSPQRQIALLNAYVDAGRFSEARNAAQALYGNASLHATQRASIDELLADLDLSDGDVLKAKEIYTQLAQGASSETERRQLEVKSHLATLPLSICGPVLKILAKRPNHREVPEPLAMLFIAEAARALPGDPVLLYLLARQHFRYRDYEGALKELKEAERLGLPQTTDSLWLAAQMMRAESLFQLRRFTESQRAFGQIAADPKLREGVRELAAEWALRSVFYQRFYPVAQRPPVLRAQ